jgi:hypothetical protein
MDFDGLWDWHGWEWPGWDALVALGTLLFAAMALVLARTARSLAKQTAAAASETAGLAHETARVVEAAHRAHETSTIPLLVGEGFNVGGRAGRVVIRLRNIGPGPAVITHPRPQMRADADEHWCDGDASDLVVASGAVVALTFERDDPSSEIVAQVAYTDVAGGQYRRTRLLLLTNLAGWAFKGFALYLQREPTLPTLISGSWRDGDREAV